MSVDIVLLLKITPNESKNHTIEKMYHNLTTTLEKYQKISIIKQKPNFSRYQYQFDSFILISITKNNKLITFNYYFREFEEEFTKKIVRYMALFSNTQVTLNQLIAITLLKEWRRKYALIELKSEIIEIFIISSEFKIVGQIVIILNTLDIRVPT
jgi:hypothetical protein